MASKERMTPPLTPSARGLHSALIMDCDHCQVTCNHMCMMVKCCCMPAGAEELLEGLFRYILDILGHPAEWCPVIGQCKDQLETAPACFC